MSLPPTTTDRVSRRRVLQTTGGLLAGATILAGPSAAQEDGLQMNVRRESIDPERDYAFAVEVTFPSGTFEGMDISFPRDTYIGPRRTFIVEDGTVRIDPDLEEDVATPVRVREVSETRLIMYFDNEDIRYPNPDNWDGTLGLGVFPEKNDVVPDDSWDTDTVRVTSESATESLTVDVRRETIDPEEDDDIPVEVTVPEGLLPDDVSFPSDVYMGVGNAFETIEEDGGQEFVTISDEYEDGVANPEEVQDFGNPDEWPKRYLMTFATQDLRYPQPDNWDGTLGLGVFPDGVDDFVPDDSWDTDEVGVVRGPSY